MRQIQLKLKQYQGKIEYESIETKSTEMEGCF